VRLRRVRHARLTVDYAALRLGVPVSDRSAVAERYRRTWADQIELRVEPAQRAALRSEIDDEIDGFFDGER